MKSQWRRVAQAFQQAKEQVKQQRREYTENRVGLSQTDLQVAKLKIKSGLDLPKPVQTKPEMVTRVRQNSLLPPLKNTSLPSYNKNK